MWEAGIENDKELIRYADGPREFELWFDEQNPTIPWVVVGRWPTTFYF